MDISKMIDLISREIRIPLVIYNQKKILAKTYKFSCEEGEFAIYKISERVEPCEIFRSKDENQACERFTEMVRAIAIA